jgi:ABC-type glutathione transport system ATPase component
MKNTWQNPTDSRETGALLCVRRLSKDYVQRHPLSQARFLVRALDNVNLSVPRGKTLAIIGDSGAGKSTLARCLALLESPTQGDIWFEGTSLHRLPKRDLFSIRREIQLIFQDPVSALNPRFTAGEIIAEPLAIQKHGTKVERLQQVSRLLEQVGLPQEWHEKRPLEFSGGQRQRLAIARALALNPKLLVLDEALSAVDVLNQSLILSLLADLQKRHLLTYVYVSHDLPAVRGFADEVAVMYQGQIVEQKPASELFAAPEHPRTQELLAAMPSVSFIYNERFAT